MKIIDFNLKNILTKDGYPRHSGQILNLISYRFYKKSARLKSQPLTLGLAITDTCNLKCNMCHAHSKHIGDFDHKHKPTKDIDFKMYTKILNKFNKAIAITLVGSGEPLLNKDFFKMVDYGARIMKMDVSTNTNGILLDKETIEKVVSTRLSIMTISVNGDSEEEFNRMTGMQGELYSKVIENIKNLVLRKKQKKSQIIIDLHFIIDKENWKKMPAMIKLCEDLDVNMVSFSNFLPSPFKGYNAEERCLTVNDTQAVDFINNLKNNEFKIRVNFPTPINFFKRKICEDHFTKLRIDGDGNVGGCSTMLLNLEKNGKYYDKQVWNNEYFQRMRRIFMDFENDRRLEPCMNCPSSSS
jgi:MoaA/NifB/PqqE/SkfB family radical SAM enzyme